MASSVSMSLLLSCLCLANLARAQDCQNLIPGTHGEKCPDEGAEKFPQPEHCSRYYLCNSGCYTLEECPSGELYDVETQLCQLGERVNCGERDCDGRDCRVSTTVTSEPFQCPDETEAYFPNEDNCIKYWYCHDGLAEEEVCDMYNGIQLLWLTEATWCDFPENVFCGDRPICDVNDQNCGGAVAPASCESIVCVTAEDIEKAPCDKCFCACDEEGSQGEEVCCNSENVFNPTTGKCEPQSSNPSC